MVTSSNYKGDACMSLIIKPMKLFNYPKLHEGVLLLMEPSTGNWESGHTELLRRKTPRSIKHWADSIYNCEDLCSFEYPVLNPKTGTVETQQVCIVPVEEDMTEDQLRFKLLEFVIRYFPEEGDKGTVCFPYASFGDVIEETTKARPNVQWLAFME